MTDKKTFNIELTESQCIDLAQFIEFNIFNFIRDDEEIDNIDWLTDIIDTYKKIKECTKGE